MAPGAPVDELYDFVYRDTGRLASYYAQIFGGRLLSLEESDTNKSGTSRGGKAGVAPFAEGELVSTKETEVAAKRTIDPHELITVDVLTALVKSGRIKTEGVAGAPNGSLIMTQGVLLFMDGHIVGLAGAAIEHISATLTDTSGVMGFVAALIKGLTIPSAFLLKTNDGHLFGGTIKDAGLEEPISAHHFKHGAAGLRDIHMIGVTEASTPPFPVAGADLLTTGQQAAQAMCDLMFPKNAIRVTPLALFRKL